MITLTPNRRLAAFAQRFHNQEQIQSGLKCWPTLTIYPYNVWYMQLWQLCLENLPIEYSPLLADYQQQLLMEQIIQKSTIGSELLRLGPTAATVLQAWTFVQQWGLTLDQVATYAPFDQDVATFCHWTTEYQTWLQQHNYLDFEAMLLKLHDILPDLIAFIPRQITLRGMHDLPPLHQAIITRLEELGINFSHDDLLNKQLPLAVKYALQDADQEWHAAANWAASIVKQNSEEIIGIVIPELGMQRTQVAAIFSKYLPAELVNMSAPLKLSFYDLINFALLLLQATKDQIEYREFSLILRSLYIRSAQQYINERALLDVELRLEVDGIVTWKQLNKFSSRFDQDFAAILDQVQTLFPELKGLHSPVYWVKKIDQIMTIWGWPGDIILDKQQQDLIACWHDVLNKYTKLSFILPEQTFTQAIQSILRLTTETDFLPAETGQTRVHVLGILEADGLLFDQLWITGMSQDTWPMEARPNPYIPIELQVTYDLPKSSAQRELKIAQRLTTNFQRGAKQQVIFSYPLTVDQTPINASNLINHIPEQNFIFTRTKDLFKIQPLEKIIDQQGSIFTAAKIPSGSRALELQIKCPFKAYTNIRLQANSLEQPKRYLTARQRGSLMHLVLEKFWQLCISSEQLLEWWPLQAKQILQQVIAEVIIDYQQMLPNVFNDNFAKIETQRIFNIAWRWLQFEAQRAPFMVVGIEKEVIVQIAGVKLKLRIDRIDQIEGGGLVIIDYKTGTVSNTQWLELPLIAPQLPLYAYSMLEQVVALVYADVSADGIKFIGAALEKDLLPGVKEFPYNFTEQSDLWRQGLHNAVQMFVNGNATVNPINAQICSTCDLHMLCRVHNKDTLVFNTEQNMLTMERADVK